MPTTRVDPYRGFNFLVEIDGITQAGFQECSGLDASTDPVDYREGADPKHVRKLTGLNKYSPITLKRGITDSDELWKWRKTVIDGKVERRNGSIVLLDEAGERSCAGTSPMPGPRSGRARRSTPPAARWRWRRWS